jgi:hypothetical protein
VAVIPGGPGWATPFPSAAPAAPGSSPYPGGDPDPAAAPGGPGTGGPGGWGGTGGPGGWSGTGGSDGAVIGGPGGAAGGSDNGLGGPGTGTGSGTNGSRADGTGSGARPADADVAGLFREDSLTRQILFTSGVSTTVTLVAAFLLFGRRRRDGDMDDGDLATAAASAYGGPLAVAPAVCGPLGIDPGTGGTDTDLPRWRRPSLLAARKSDPIRTTDIGSATRLAFAGPAAAAGVERRTVRYRIVRLLDRPDELTGDTVGSLDEGDQVAIVGQSGLYRRVETPDGRSGWLHKMTLGDVVEAPDPEDDEIDPDVLMAYLAARGRG